MLDGGGDAVRNDLLAVEKEHRVQGVGHVDRKRQGVVALPFGDLVKQVPREIPALHDGGTERIVSYLTEELVQ